MVNPIHLRTLLAIVQLGSFTAAASRLGYTASAVSQQMAALERDTAVVLFDRAPRSVRPTEAATIMAQHAVKVLADIENLLAATAGAHSIVAEELRLGLFPSLATPLLTRLLAREAWCERNVDLKVSVGEPSHTIQRMRSAGELDIAFIYQVGQVGLNWVRSGDRHWMGDDNFQVVVPSSWGLEPDVSVSPKVLENKPWILHHPGSSVAAVIEKLFVSSNIRPRVVAYCDDYQVSLDMVAAGIGASFIPQLALRELPAQVAVLDVPQMSLARSIFALVVEDVQSSAMTFFLQEVAAVLLDFGIVPERP